MHFLARSTFSRIVHASEQQWTLSRISAKVPNHKMLELLTLPDAKRDLPSQNTKACLAGLR